MCQSNVSKIPAPRSILSVATATALVAAVAIPMAQPALAGSVNPPPVPPSIKIEAGHVPYLVGHAIGTQNYVCQPKNGVLTWVLYTPQATLFSDGEKQIITHFFSPNPLATQEFLPTWQHSRDTSAVWVKPDADPYTGADFVEAGAVAWLRLRVVATMGGPTGGDALAETTFIHRVNTSGGVAPATGCSVSENVGNKVFIPYTADYFFYKEAEGSVE